MTDEKDPKSPSETILALESATADPVYVDKQLKAIERVLTKVLFGDYTAVIRMEEADFAWGNLAMHINVAINAARNAIERAERSERQAEAARDEALAAARAESNFLTNVSHELRTPLASIRAAAEILTDYPEETVETRIEFTDIILKESERLTRLIQNVLDLGKIQARRLHWDFRELQLSYTLSEVVRNFNLARSKHRVTVQLTIENELPEMTGDRDRLKQLWTNLIANAIKFSGTSDKVWVRARQEFGAIIVEVRDLGVGLRPEDHETIFQRFSQVSDDTLTDKPEGTGLGLAIAREIVAYHGGKIQVESAVGTGSTFRVVLPVLGHKDLEAIEDSLRREQADEA